MNTAEAIILSQLPLVIVGILLWLEIRTIRKDLTRMNNSSGYNSYPKDIDESSIHKMQKSTVTVTEE